MVLETLPKNQDAQNQPCHHSKNSSKKNLTPTTETSSGCRGNENACALEINEK